MSVYTPNMKASELSSGPGALSFLIEDPLRPGEIPPAMIKDPSVPIFYHGQFLQDSDLNILFIKDALQGVDPTHLTYEVGFFYGGTDLFSPIGNRHREPYAVRIGRYRPNFIVGDKWLTGRYAVRWTYRIKESDVDQKAYTLFWLETSGVVDNKIISPMQDIPATVVVL
jgi:hypothetical protein